MVVGVSQQSLPAILREHAGRAPRSWALTFVGAEGGPSLRLTYGELWARVSALAARLREEGCVGSTVLLLARSEVDVSLGFLACLVAGAIAVPLGVPDQARLVRFRARMQAVVRDARPAAILGGAVEREQLQKLGDLEELNQIRWICIDQQSSAQSQETSSNVVELTNLPDPDSVAWLQYTSGSTSNPKGVLVTHRNLLENERMIAAVHGGIGPGLSWLPLSHDMGLVGGLLQPLFLGTEVLLMSPVSFLRRPARWLQLISEHRLYFSAAPSFGYDYCIRQVRDEDLQGVDLSCWRVAFNGAEPVRADILARFVERFGRWGVSPELFYPCYGLAEATLLVSGRRPAKTAPRILQVDSAALARGQVRQLDAGTGSIEPRAQGSSVLVSCGQVAAGLEVAIVEAEHARSLGDGEVGEIWVRGASVAAGYWRDDEASAR
ncbi:MAG TPA: AMP-binding protein, partial [Kofleriaceae bacterium]|nr:AMP-binding protein [Kofleriaceae bacterium]